MMKRMGGKSNPGGNRTECPGSSLGFILRKDLRAGGSITFFAGIWSQRPAPKASAAAAINSAIEGLGRALALELAPIRLNTISPGMVAPPLYGVMAPEKREAMFKEAAASIPARRVATAEEIALGVLYLMSSEYSTGTALFVDGGNTLR